MTTDPGLPDILSRALSEAGLNVGDERISLLRQFLSHLLEANQTLNLTRDAEPVLAVERHVVEPLAAWRAVESMLPAGALIDVGSGGGAPGLPIAIVAPDRPVTLLETRERKAAYLQESVVALGLKNVTVHHGRAEEYAKGAGRERFAVALARALARLPIAVEVLLPLVETGGSCVVYAGPSVNEQLTAATGVAERVGGATPKVQAVSWPGSSRDLRLVTIAKLTPSPARYPRSVRRLKKDQARARRTPRTG